MIDVTVKIGRETPSKDWLRLAHKRAVQACTEAGLDFNLAHVYVELPEWGRCFVKHSGTRCFTAYG